MLTFGFSPQVGSVLIDAGSNSLAIHPVTVEPLNEDIFGADRINGPSVDVGAVEVISGFYALPIPTVSSTGLMVMTLLLLVGGITAFLHKEK